MSENEYIECPAQNLAHGVKVSKALIVQITTKSLRCRPDCDEFKELKSWKDGIA